MDWAAKSRWNFLGACTARLKPRPFKAKQIESSRAPSKRNKSKESCAFKTQRPGGLKPRSCQANKIRSRDPSKARQRREAAEGEFAKLHAACYEIRTEGLMGKKSTFSEWLPAAREIMAFRRARWGQKFVRKS